MSFILENTVDLRSSTNWDGDIITAYSITKVDLDLDLDFFGFNFFRFKFRVLEFLDFWIFGC